MKNSLKPPIYYETIFILLIFVSLAILYVLKINTNKEIVEPIHETHVSMFKEYKSNKVRADKLYKGKRVVVTGKINDIINNKRIWLIDTSHESLFIHVIFDESCKDEILKLSVGQNVTIMGTCGGMSIFKHIKFYDVCIHDN